MSAADANHPNPEVAKRLQHIATLHRTDVDLRLGASPYNALLERLGNPHKKIPPVVHIAGTNGKGSTLAFLRAMLEAANYKVHVYTSPHLLTFNERIRLAGKLIDDEELIELHDVVSKANAGVALTFFEFTTALAFLAFARHPADIMLLETGMGGRLDCTNVIEKPLVTAITKISHDHMEFLGNTLEDIADEKAGIMKQNVPCVIGAQMDTQAVMPVFESRSRALNAPLIIAGKSLPRDYPAPSLVGAHQIENAATALAIIEQLPFPVSDAHKRKGLIHADWPARMQRIRHGSCAALLPPDWELWFDAAHNDSGALALGAQLKTWKRQNPGTPIHLIVGLAADKDTDAFFGPLSGLYDTLTLVDLPRARRPQSATQLQTKLSSQKTNCADTLMRGISTVTQESSKKGLICVAGSLYLYLEMF